MPCSITHYVILYLPLIQNILYLPRTLYVQSSYSKWEQCVGHKYSKTKLVTNSRGHFLASLLLTLHISTQNQKHIFTSREAAGHGLAQVLVVVVKSFTFLQSCIKFKKFKRSSIELTFNSSSKFLFFPLDNEVEGGEL